jgi:hypothetical protein
MSYSYSHADDKASVDKQSNNHSIMLLGRPQKQTEEGRWNIFSDSITTLFQWAARCLL